MRAAFSLRSLAAALLLAGPLSAGALMPVCAQHVFTGRIEFERKVNIHRQFEKDDGEASPWVASLPKFYVSYFNLFFAPGKTHYAPGRETPGGQKTPPWGSGAAPENVVYSDLAGGRVTAAKKIFEETFLVQDSVRAMRWKMLPEVRTIAGYPCRKAVGRICDSVVVVAFYTDALPVTGGPESFAGLPGMILEIAIPRLFTTWVATVVEQDPPPVTAFAVPAKGKKTTAAGLSKTLSESGLKDWGKWAARNMWWSIL